MARKPESTFCTGVHKHLPKALYVLKNNNPFVGGIPDVWYSGNAADLWVEYKWVPRVPKHGRVEPAKLLSALQTDWLRRRYTEGRDVAVIIGCPEGGVLLCDLDWEKTVEGFPSLVKSRPDLARWIESKTTR